MKLDASTIAASTCTALTGTRCLVRSGAMPLTPYSTSVKQVMQHGASCTFQASIAGRMQRASRPGSSESSGCSWPIRPWPIAYERHTASASIKATSQHPAVLQGDSLRHRCLPLDRRWQGQASIHCLSDAVGPLAGSSEAECDGRSSDGHSEQQAQASQVCGSPSCPAGLWHATTDG